MTEGVKRITFHPWEGANGSEWVQVQVDGRIVGNYEKVKGGFLPNGKRKPRKTEKEAQQCVVQDAINKYLKRACSWLDAYGELY